MPKPQSKTMSATDMRIDFSDVLTQVKKNKLRLTITKSGKPIAVLMSLAEYERLTASAQPPESEK